MAKKQSQPTKLVTVEFPRTGNPWTDAGIVGLYRILNDLAPYADRSGSLSSPDEDRSSKFPDVRHDELHSDRFEVSGPSDQVQACLEWAYDRLIETYFNKSNEKQKREQENYNFYYDSNRDSFVTFPKVKAPGVASLLFDKSPRKSRGQVSWAKEADKSGKLKPKPGRLTEEYAHLQDRLEAFLKLTSLKAGPKGGLLIDGPNRIRPKVDIRVKSGRLKTVCFLSGRTASNTVNGKETAFPLMGGSRCFINGNTNWPKLGWTVDFAGKFVPAIGFYVHKSRKSSKHLHVFFPISHDLRRINELVESLKSMVDLDPNLNRNFNLALGPAKVAYLYRGRAEIALAFLHRVFVELSRAEELKQAKEREAVLEGESVLVIDDDELEATPLPEPPEIEPEISPEEVFRAMERKGHVTFAVVSASKKGNVWMARDFWSFQDVLYLARLFGLMQQVIAAGPSGARPTCSAKTLFRTLIDFEAKDEARTLLRNRVCGAVLRRQSVLSFIEQHAFRINSHGDAVKAKSVNPLLDFARLYETEIRKGTLMKYSYEKMVETSTRLGKVIGKAVAEAIKDKNLNETPGRARGVLFRLRKTRTTSGFMDELARLQSRYKIEVPLDVLDASVLNPESFEDFRGFCVVAALSRFIYASREPKPQAPASN